MPSNEVTRRNGKQPGGRRLALGAILRPQLALWLAGHIVQIVSRVKI